MPYFYLIAATLSSAGTSIFNGYFARKNESRKNTSAFYSLFCAGFAFLSWGVMFLIEPSFNWMTVLYALGFSAFYLMVVSGYALALKSGPVMLTSLFISLSLIGVTVWGFFFWDSKFTWLVGIGLVLVVAAVSLCLYKGKQENETEEEKNTPKITLKWIFFVILSFVGNAGCTITQRTQQMAQAGQHGNLLMVIATGIATAVFAIVYFVKDPSDFKPIFRDSGYFPMLGGLLNFFMNLFVILMASTTLSPSLIYPVISVGSLAIVTIASIFFFKEKMKWWQWLGVAFGAAAVAILSL